MKAVYINKYGGVETLEYGDRPQPQIKPDQVLVEIHASCVNPRDWLLREGKYVFRYFMPSFPVILGSDISGVVVDVGKDVKRFTIGDEVFGLQTIWGGMGGYAEYVAIDESALAKKPAQLSHLEAAGVPCAALTAYEALKKIGQCKTGSRVTIIGASGGVGSYAVQIAKAFGAVVTATTSTSNLDLISSLGADRVIDYKQEKITSLMRDQDLVFDVIGKESLSRCAAMMSRNGRYITTIPNFTNLLEAVYSNSLRWVSFGNFQSAHTVLVPSDGLALAEIATLMTSGKVRTLIDSVYSLSEVKEAHKKSRSWRSRGKIILQVK